MEDIDRAIHDRTIQTSAVLEMLGRKALEKMYGLMEASQNEAIQFKATQDLLDRSPETSKIQKHAISSFSLAGEDAKQLAAAMVQAAQIRQAFEGEVQGDYIRIPVDPIQDDSEALIYAEQAQLLAPLRQGDTGNTEGAEGRGPSATAGAEDLQSGNSVPEDPAAA
jgi:hypothetical protein